jgi:hypothetical protein
MYSTIAVSLNDYINMYSTIAVSLNDAVGDPVIKRGGEGIRLTSLTLPHFCAHPNQGPGFPTSYIVVSLCVCVCVQ